MELFSLKGKTALVTGGTRGIGRAMTTAFAEAGADIVILQRNQQQNDFHDHIRALGRQCWAFECDLLSHESVVKAVQEVLTQHKIDIVLNGAGIMHRCNAELFPFDKYQEVLQTNLSSVFAICREVGAYWLSHESQGAIINVASLASFQGGVRMVAYAASKGGLLQLTKALSNEWAGKGIRVNAVAPGSVSVPEYVTATDTHSYIETDMNSDTRTNADKTYFESISTRIPAGHWGSPDDMKGVAIFLASDASRYLTGECITVDGGWMAR